MGHPPTTLVYGDNYHERPFYYKHIPSIKQDVLHVGPRNTSGLETAVIPANVSVVTLSTESEIAGYCQRALSLVAGVDQQLYIGFDTEHSTESATGMGASAELGRARTSVISLASSELGCAVLHLAVLESLPDDLRTMLIHPRIIKVGRSVATDCAWLQADFNCRPSPILELSEAVKVRELLPIGSGTSLQDLVAVVLGLHLTKDDLLRKGDWDSAPLSPEQIAYAASDAYFGLRVWNAIVDKQAYNVKLIGNSVTDPRKLPIGEWFFLRYGGDSRPSARGQVVEQPRLGSLYPCAILPDGSLPDPISMSQSRILVKICQVIQPAKKLSIYNRPLSDFGSSPFLAVVDSRLLYSAPPYMPSPIDQPDAPLALSTTGDENEEGERTAQELEARAEAMLRSDGEDNEVDQDGKFTCS